MKIENFKLKIILILLIGFTFGFMAHALFFPNLLLNEPTQKHLNLQPQENQLRGPENDPVITKVFFDGEHFSRKRISIQVTRSIQIINQNKDKPMQLVSSELSLTTPRKYGYTEGLLKQFDKKGEYIVSNLENLK